MEATGHYWRNLFSFLVAEGFSISLLNPLRARRFAEQEMQRTKTDHIDALGIARFAAQKRPKPMAIPGSGEQRAPPARQYAPAGHAASGRPRA